MLKTAPLKSALHRLRHSFGRRVDCAPCHELAAARTSYRRVGRVYLAGGVVLALGAGLGPGFSVLLWPALSLTAVSLGYYWHGPSVFEKQLEGQHSVAATAVLAPYQFGAWLAYRRNAQGLRQASSQVGDLTLCHRPAEYADDDVVLDLCAELPAPRGHPAGYESVPMLDLVPPSFAQLDAAMLAIERLQLEGRVAVHCALGIGRSVAVAAAWQLQSKAQPTPAAALDFVVRCRVGAKVRAQTLEVLTRWWTRRCLATDLSAVVESSGSATTCTEHAQMAPEGNDCCERLE